MIKRDRKSQNISYFSIKFNNFDVLIDFLYLLIDFKVIFFAHLIKNRLKVIDFHQKEIEMAIDNSKLSIESESAIYFHPITDGLESESSTIRFVGPHRLSLLIR